jgi:Ribonuclease G/E
MKRRAVVENAIGETRAAVYEGRRLVELHLSRESQAHLPQAGDIYLARIQSLEPSLNGAFLDLGGKEPGFLSFTRQSGMPRLTEGQLLQVSVSRAAEADKAAVVKFIEVVDSGKPGPIQKLNLQERLSKRFENITFDEASVSAIDNAIERDLAIKGGGSITIEQTQALLAIDVDKGQGTSALDVGIAASNLISSQLRLRGLGGLVVIDFPNLRQTRQRNQLLKALERAFENDPAIVKIAPVSRFGCVELTRSLDYQPLDRVITNRFSEPTIETLALRALRQLEREALNNRGAQFTLEVSQNTHDWLMGRIIDWEASLNERIGPRYNIKTSDIAGFTITADR